MYVHKSSKNWEFLNVTCFFFYTVHLSNNGPLNAYLEVILQLSTHGGRCRNKILESEVSFLYSNQL